MTTDDTIENPISNTNQDTLNEKIIAALRTVYDPEIPVNIYDLGLIYDVIIEPHNNILIKMTLTSPGCPVAATFPGTVERAVEALEEVEQAIVELVWDPPWTQDAMSEAVKLQLGLL
jgi:FeS assembly SUF system protein